MKRLAKVIISGIDHMVNFIVLMLILLLMFLSCYMLWDSNQVFEAADAKNYEAYMPSENHTKSFEELQKINPDVFGWIRINDTNVNYPLLQAEDDDTYMNTDAEGNYSLSGSIFLHCANAPDFSDFNNLHNVDIGKHGVAGRLQDGDSVTRRCTVERIEHAAAAADDRHERDLAAGVRRNKHTHSAGEHE